MIILGLILALIGYLAGPPVLLTIGVIVLMAGLIALAAGGFGHPVGGRRWWW